MLLSLSLHPIEGARDGLEPALVQLLARRRVHLGIPGLVHAPILAQFVGVLPEPNGQAGGVGRTEGGCLGHRRADYRHAQDIGLAFQVVDDILNVEGDPEALGKAVGTDDDRQKNTYPGLMGIEKSKEFAQKLVNSALKALDGFDKRADPLRALAVYIIRRNH